MLTVGATVAWISAAIVSLLSIHFGDQSIAAVIAAVASTLNAIILWRARIAQTEIRSDVKEVAKDTGTRSHQIEELRSLSIERNRHINRLERIADRLESVVAPTHPGGRRKYDPPTSPD